MSRKVSLGVLGCLAAWLIPITLTRLAAVDEGYYLMAARLTMQGSVPYRDFVYLQMPLFPYLYGGWMSLFGFSFAAARWFTALMLVAVGWLLSREVALKAGVRLGLWAALVFAGNGLVVSFDAAAKTYTVTTLLLTGAWVLAERPGRGQALLAGLLAALAVDVRLMFAPCVLAFLYHFHRQRRAQATSYFLLGSAAGLALCLPLFLLDREGFLFGNLGFHSLRTESGLVGNLAQKANVVFSMLGVQAAYGVASFQWPLLGLANLLFGLGRWQQGKPLGLPTYLAMTLGAVSLLPTPTFGQYFVTLVPFLVFNAALGLRELLMQEVSPSLRRQLTAMLAICTAAYLAVCPLDVLNNLGVDTPGVEATDLEATLGLARVARISQALQEETRPGDLVLSTWPGYLLETHARPLPGTENEFPVVTGAAGRMDPALRARRHVVTEEDLCEALRRRVPAAVVVGINAAAFYTSPETRRLLQDSGYQERLREGSTVLFIRSTPAGADSPPREGGGP